MLKIETQKGRASILRASGTVVEITTDFLSVIGGTYAHWKRVDPVAAEDFRKGIVAGITSPKSPVFGMSSEGLHIIVRQPPKE